MTDSFDFNTLDPDKVIEEACHLLSTYGWSVGEAARKSTGAPCEWYDKDAQSFCALGAIWRAMYNLTPKHIQEQWNSEYERTLNSVSAYITDSIEESLRVHYPHSGRCAPSIAEYNDDFASEVTHVTRLLRDEGDPYQNLIS